jgi:protoheme IX farnesyltransferase
LHHKIIDTLELTKPKVTLLNLLVGVTCFILAVFPHVNLLSLAAFSAVGYLAAGGCGVLNSVYDKDIDKLMTRTSKRAIPSGKIKAEAATALGALMISASVTAAYLLYNPLTALMVALGAVFYLAIYTVWLKRVSPWNVVIGGFAGCFAGLSGWTAVTNTLSLLPLLVALLDFVWTPGHLWGLAINKIREYRTAGVPMLPVRVGAARAAPIIFGLNVLAVGLSFLFPLFHLAGAVYLTFAIGGGLFFLFQNRGFLSSASGTYGFRVFASSMPYLACLMLGLIVDKFVAI